MPALTMNARIGARHDIILEMDWIKNQRTTINNRIIKSTSMAAIASMLVGTAFAAGVVPAYAGEVANNDITITAAAHGQSTKPDMANRVFPCL